MKRIPIVLITAMASMLLTTTTSEAHEPSEKACTTAWQDASAGHKYTAKQRCLVGQSRHRCVTHPRTVPGRATVKGKILMRGKSRRHSPHWRNQRKVIAWLANEALRRKLPKPVLISAIATTTQESSARELAGGHGTSAGPFQLINTHGPQWKRKTIWFSGDWYYNGAIRKWRSSNGKIGIVALSHHVQSSRYPTAVARWVREATRTTNLVLGSCELPTR